MTQYQIEQMAGITDQAIADYLMAGETPAARNALSLLSMQVACCEGGGMALLQAAVNDCRKEMQVAK